MDLGETALCSELHDVLALETRLHAWVRAELSREPGGGDDTARALLGRLEPRGFAHQEALEQALERLHGHFPALRRALAATRGRLAHWLEPSAPPEPSGGLRGIYTLLSATSAAYLILGTSARTLGDSQTAALAERCADDTHEFLDEIALLLPEMARQEIERSEPSEMEPGGEG